MSTASVNGGVDALRAELRSVFGSRLRAVLLYGPHLTSRERMPNSLAVVDSLTFEDLAACAALAAAWTRRAQPTPMIVPAQEFRRSLDAFPLEYGDIIAHHVLVAGDDPFTGLEVKVDDIRRACEVQAQSHILHLRQGYLESAGRPPEVARLMAASARPLRALLTQLARLDAVDATDTASLVTFAETRIGVVGSPIRQVLAAGESGSVASAEAELLYRPYLQAMERLSAYVDSWQRTPAPQ